MSIPKVKRYENGKEITGQVDTPYEITWDEWQLLTDAEKEKRKWLITDVPGAKGFITVENMKLLWSNPSPTSSFAAQSVTLASDDYDFLMVLYRESTGVSYQLSEITNKGVGGTLCIGDIGGAGNTSRIRRFSFTSSKILNFTGGTVGSSSASASNDAVVIPTVIYGFKKQTEIRFNALAENVKATFDYSTEEHPIGTWIDGSTLYEKTVDTGALPNATTKAIAHGISNLKRAISIEGYAYNNGNSISIPNVNTTDAVYQTRVYVDSIYIRMQSGNDQSSWAESYVTIRYTKTT